MCMLDELESKATAEYIFKLINRSPLRVKCVLADVSRF
jgi:hypothetical protein